MALVALTNTYLSQWLELQYTMATSQTAIPWRAILAIGFAQGQVVFCCTALFLLRARPLHDDNPLSRRRQVPLSKTIPLPQ
eukprot:6044186-Amphidinium_carterae.1